MVFDLPDRQVNTHSTFFEEIQITEMDPVLDLPHRQVNVCIRSKMFEEIQITEVHVM